MSNLLTFLDSLLLFEKTLQLSNSAYVEEYHAQNDIDWLLW